ncbi:MAG: helix-turn-helix domain-containing protein, partial [Armatimonadota bacterium]
MRKKRPGAAFADWLKDQRKRRYLLQREMAKRCGVSTRQYRRWE